MAHEFDMVVRGGLVADGTGGDLFKGDIGVRDGRIAAIGSSLAAGREEIDARGLLVTPGFIDVHTHYDGQLTWSERLTPSSNHGVTTVVTGNCGVGFAPCREADRDDLIRLMEGVEDIPEIVMAEGLPWDWNSFPDFLDFVEKRPHDIDFAVLLPHSPLRVFVMGKRAVRLEPATEADRAAMRALASEAMRAGAAGFATSRNIFHRASDGGIIPSVAAEEAELREIALGLADAGRGRLQAITVSGAQRLQDYELLHRVARAAGRPLSYTLLPIEFAPNLWREVIAAIAAENASGGEVKAQVFNRPVGLLLGLETNYHPFAAHSFYVEHIANLPHDLKVAEMRKPEVRRILLQGDGAEGLSLAHTMRRFDRIYPLGEPANYEPAPSTSVAAVAERKGWSPKEVLFDMLLESEGRAKLLVVSTGYSKGNLDEVLEMLQEKDTVLALGDGGAHYGMICDASYTTYTLTHWVRDRRNGGRLNLADAVRMLTHDPAQLYRFHDRGRLAPGLKADLNVIDFDRLALPAPKIVQDLPAGGRRLTQDSAGYAATLVSGTPIQLGGEDTGARLGKLVRGAGA